MLKSTNPSVITYLNDKDPDWAETQTIPPSNLQVSDLNSNSIILTWSPIAYTQDGGYYEIYSSTNPDGPYIKHGETVSKTTSLYTATQLIPDTMYYFKR